MKLITSGLIIIGLAGFVLFNLINILVYGEVLIREENGYKLGAELALLLALFLYGINLFIDGIIKRLSK